MGSCASTTKMPAHPKQSKTTEEAPRKVLASISTLYHSYRVIFTYVYLDSKHFNAAVKASANASISRERERDLDKKTLCVCVCVCVKESASERALS
jgi:hypothetical protein